MDSATWVALIGVGLTILINAGGYLVAWGVMKNSVTALDKRVEALEAEAKAITEIRVQIGKLETQMEGVVEQLRDLNSNLRWMRTDEVPPFKIGGAQSPPTRRGRRP